VLRIFLASDFHGSDIVFRKFVNAGKYYKADALFYAGDITGKVLVLVTRRGDVYEANVLGEKVRARGEEELKRLLSMLENKGYYYKILDENDLGSIANNASAVENLMLEEMRIRLEKWMELATNALKGSDIKMFLMPGNDDPPIVNEILERFSNDNIVNISERTFSLPGGIEGFGLPYSNMTPWNLPGDLPEEALEKKISELVSRLRDPSNSLFVIHVPPYDTIIDVAPKLENLRIKVDVLGVEQAHVGSTAVRKAIENYQPVASFHGHIHESRGVARIGRTYCFNPGSEYDQGVLRGVIINLDYDRKSSGFKVKSYMFTYS